jgi:hypothetical protein
MQSTLSEQAVQPAIPTITIEPTRGRATLGLKDVWA